MIQRSVLIAVLCVTLFAFVTPVFALDDYTIEWQECLGGDWREYSYCVLQNSIGHFIIGGYAYTNYITQSSLAGNSGDIIGPEKDWAIWLVELDTEGNIDQSRVLGGNRGASGGYNVAYALKNTQDSGYILAGVTDCNNTGDVGINHGSRDAWVIKLNNGLSVDWQTCLGGNKMDSAYDICQLNNGDYIVVGTTGSNNTGNVGINHGSNDLWVVKLNATGSVLWQNCFGGSNSDHGCSICQTSDGGYIVAGETCSDDGNVTGRHGMKDIWILKLSGDGDLEWQRCFGGGSEDSCVSIIQTSDDGFLCLGTASINKTLPGDISQNLGESDLWLFKLDLDGNMQWDRSFGGSANEFASRLTQVSDGSFIVIGSTTSNDCDAKGNHGMQDALVVKVNGDGAKEWSGIFGGVEIDNGTSIMETDDGGLIFSGITCSPSIPRYHGAKSEEDYWIVKLISSKNPFFRLHPGWNFVSIPKRLETDHNTASIFSGVNTSGHSLFQYNASAGTWAAMKQSDIVRPLDGIWIYANSTTKISVSFDTDPLMAPPQKTLAVGWNSIGYASTESATAKDTLCSVDDQWSTLIGFDAKNQIYEKSIINDGSGDYSDLRAMAPYKGYWVFMKEPGILSAIGS